MNLQLTTISISRVVFFIALGILLYIGFYIINHYVIPLLDRHRKTIQKYWQKIQIIVWLLYFGLFFIQLFKGSPAITTIFTLVIIGLGWNFWRNIFSGIIIKFNDNLTVGQSISTSFATGKLKTINLAQSELINTNGELVVIPNYTLKTAILTHIYKKSNIQTYTFFLDASKGESLDEIANLVRNNPYISSNQKIEVKLSKKGYKVKAAVIDPTFLEKIVF